MGDYGADLADEAANFLVDEDRPGVALASLPASLIVSGLMDQLSSASAYSQQDYLSPVLSAAALLRARHEEDGGTVSEVAAAVRDILSAVAAAVASDWGADLEQLGLDPQSPDYEQDVAELYRFFVLGRLDGARRMLYGLIRQDRRRFADLYRKTVEKRNQTTSEARKVFATFDDVVVWSSIPQILSSFAASDDWSFPLAEVLDRVGGPDAASPGFLAAASALWTSESFAARYAAPALARGDAISATALALKDRWLTESPRKKQED
jgi:hypothetical protein